MPEDPGKRFYILNSGDRPTIGGRYDIGDPPPAVQYYPLAVTLVRNEESGAWMVEEWRHKVVDGAPYVEVDVSPAVR